MGFSLSLATRRRLTALIWLSGLIVAMIVIGRRPTDQIRALAWAEPIILAAPEEGVLLELGAALHDSVTAGEIVARLDPGPLTAHNALLEAELEALQHEESAASQARSRRFERDRESAALELAKLEATVEEDQALVMALHEKLAIDERLVAEGVVPRERAGDARRELEVVETRLAANRERLRLARRSFERSGMRADAAEGSNPWQIVTARQRLNELDNRRQRLALRSASTGQITLIYRAAGEWLKAGEPVLRISPMTASEVHAWLDSQATPDVHPGMSTEIRRTTGETLTGTMISIGAERLQLPEELWFRADIPEWGYLARIILTEGSPTLAPGEPVQVGLVR